MSSNDQSGIDPVNLLGEVMTMAESMCAKLNELDAIGKAETASDLEDYAVRMIRERRKQMVNDVNDSKLASPKATRKRARLLPKVDLDRKRLRHRNRYAELCQDLIICKLGYNDGFDVHLQDIVDEFNHQDIEIEKGSLMSRIKRMRDAGFIVPAKSSRQGVYHLDIEGKNALQGSLSSLGLSI